MGDPSLPASPVTQKDLARLKAALLLTEEDEAALRRAGEILVPQAEQILDVWYSFVGQHDFLLAYFTGPEGPSSEYLARVRARFGQWIADTCRADFNRDWLAYQQEIGRRHYVGKNETDYPASAGTPPFVHWRYVGALVYPIYATVKPFLQSGSSDPEEIERMHQAWLKAVLLQVILWTMPYLREGAW